MKLAKRKIPLILVLTLLLSLLFSTSAFAVTAVQSGQTVILDGSEVSADVYNIDGSNYFRLRDLAALLNGGNSQFDIAFNAGDKSVAVTTGQPYTGSSAVEPAQGEDKSASCVVSDWTLTVDGLTLDVSVYNIGGNNYFKLRDLGTAVGYRVGFDSAANAAAVTSGGYSLVFDANAYESETLDYNGQSISYRKYSRIYFVTNPVSSTTQKLDVYIPEAYYSGGTVGNYTAETAPIFLPNAVGGYMSGGTKGLYNTDRATGEITGIAAAGRALAEGMVVVTPTLRGRDTMENGVEVGNGIACIVDYKAAVRYLRYNDSIMPGSAERIITDGTSAGGAMSSLIGTSGNYAGYEPYLLAINAANTRDDIFAAVAFCPIIDMENANNAYEWFFAAETESYAGGMGFPENGAISADEKLLSASMAALFPARLNALNLKNPQTGVALSLNADGSGSYQDYLNSFMLASVQEALDTGTDLSELEFITFADGGKEAAAVDFTGYVAYMGRLKAPGSFDNGMIVWTGENDLFALTTDGKGNSHYDPNLAQAVADANAAGAKLESLAGSFAVPDGLADLVYLINPMNFIDKAHGDTAANFYIRLGAQDNHTSQSVATNLYTRLANEGVCKSLDYKIQWGYGHAGDYELDELFAWIVSITK